MSVAVLIPPRIAKLDRDARGYPIPWNVLRAADGSPFFTVNDDRKHWRAIHEGLCPLCGEPLGKFKWFVGGPQSAFDPNGAYVDLPGHHDCIGFALRTCPFLAAPKYLKRIDVVNPGKLPPEVNVLLDETQIEERPAVFVSVASDRIEAGRRSILTPYVRPARPFLAVEYWRHGEQLDLATALPFLRDVLGANWHEPKLRE